MSFESDNSNTLRILIATDNHLGYLERDSVRGQDSFNAFEEILLLAAEKDVDFILLGGDLFHDSSPSLDCLTKTTQLLSLHCLGGRPNSVLIASDQSVNFEGAFRCANYYNPNINVSYPVFSIHGNHDRPTGITNMSALNCLANTGLLNYFGRCHNSDNPVLSPILLQKGSTKLGLYGIGNIPDERLHRSWRSGNVVFQRPGGGQGKDSWAEAFNMLVLHQNRAKHGATSHIPEEFIDPFLDLVFWGHEHECRIRPEHCPSFEITQPGSSVATSLSKGEAVQKSVGLLSITGHEYVLEDIALKSVRPFEFEQVALALVAELDPQDQEQCERYLVDRVKWMIERAKEKWNLYHTEDEKMPLPLIRLRVDYSGGYPAFNVRRFGNIFDDQIANPRDLLQFHRTRERVERSRPTTIPDVNQQTGGSKKSIGDYMKDCLGDQDMDILSAELIATFIDDEDAEAGTDKLLAYMNIVSNTSSGPTVYTDPDEEMKRIKEASVQEFQRVYSTNERPIEPKKARSSKKTANI
ncbi:Metallo-dependent phosphatase-like protein [Phycomyces nitens]|nr:Metallo-dependent phosphatase-like protein [Phycomyces nitens]